MFTLIILTYTTLGMHQAEYRYIDENKCKQDAIKYNINNKHKCDY